MGILIRVALYTLIGGLIHHFICKFVEWTFASEESRDYLREIIYKETGVQPTEEDIDRDIEQTTIRWVNISLAIYAIIVCYLALKGLLY